MKLNYQDFHNAICNLKKFMKEQEKLDNVIKVISPSGTNVCEFGNEFIENYQDNDFLNSYLNNNRSK